MHGPTIDLNADLGEVVTDDEAQARATRSPYAGLEAAGYLLHTF